MRSAPLFALLLIACRSTDKLPDDGTVGDTASLSVDSDGDGYTADEDCDDNNSIVHPDAAELCDGADNNCDGQIDEGVTTTFYADGDGDGFGDNADTAEACEAPPGHVPNGNDCDDSDADTFPGAAERCDGKDNDCDGTTDEEVTTTFYADADADGFGDPDAPLEDCDPGDGYVADDTDCDDTTAAASPGAEEVCDGIDNDCDKAVDEDVTTTYYQDADADGYGVADITTDACERPSGYAGVPGDCDDTTAAVGPEIEEICNNIDDDCDGDTDEDDAADASTWYADSDGDGYGDPGSTAEACEEPSGYVSDATDCDDSESAANPGEAEVCDEIDNDCDGTTDEGVTTTYYADDDADGYGDPDDTAEGCAAPSGYTDDDADCDDSTADASPDGEEVCDGLDNDCDGDTDELVCLDVSNVDPTLLEDADSAITISSDTTIDTESGAIDGVRSSGTGLSDGIYFETATQSSGPDLGVFVFDGLTIASGVTLTVEGDNGLVILSADDVDISGTIDASGAAGSDGLGTSGPTSGASGEAGGADGGDGSTNAASGASAGGGSGAGGVGSAGIHYGNGGGGGGHCYGGGGGMGDRPSVAGSAGSASAGGAGGYGGGDGGYGGDGGDPYSGSTLSPLTAGSGGGGGLSDTDYNPNGAGGAGGAGGGAVQLSVDGLLEVSGTISAAGGAGGDAYGGGGGGGSGGGILLEALEVDVTGSLDASGGSGGDGNQRWSSAATGGSAGGGSSMAGGGGATESGGGGGAAGWISLRYLDAASVTGSVTPATSSACGSTDAM